MMAAIMPCNPAHVRSANGVQAEQYDSPKSHDESEQSTWAHLFAHAK